MSKRSQQRYICFHGHRSAPPVVSEVSVRQLIHPSDKTQARDVFSLLHNQEHTVITGTAHNMS